MRNNHLFISLFFIANIVFLGACSVSKTTKTTPAGNTDLRNRIVDFALKQTGAPYLYAGKSPSTGFDCSGFTSYVLGKFNIKVSPSSSAQAAEGKKKHVDQVLPADIIVFGDGKRIQHVAMVVKRNKEGIVCVHSTTSRGVIVENISTSSYWKPKILYARDMIQP